MHRLGWYIVSYDIADPKRLKKIHRMLKKEGLAVQKSVFFVQGDEITVNALLQELEDVMETKEDDIRAYPVTHPGEVWTTGGPLKQFPLLTPGRKKKETGKPAPGKQKKGTPWYRKLFG